MLRTIGVDSVDELFEQIPESLRLPTSLDLPPGMSEIELKRFMKKLAQKNANPDEMISFLGAGSYRHFTPSVVDDMPSRGEFLTAYTPYQAEVSQGTLQALYEFQTFISLLTGMEVANGSMYEGATALAEAILMTIRIKKKNKVLVSRAVHPEYRETLRTELKTLDVQIVELPLSDGKTILDNYDTADVSCVVVQSPNFFGIVEDLASVRSLSDNLEAMMIVTIPEPMSLGILNAPGNYGADIVVGEAQSFGSPPQFGGPYCGFFATKDEYVKQMPGRLVGKTHDINGKEGYVVALAAREQHIRREKATSNICTNETLVAITATVFLSLVGPKGLREIAMQNLQKAAYAKEVLSELDGFDMLFHPDTNHTFNEFVLRSHGLAPEKILSRLCNRNILGGVALGRWYPEYSNCILVSVTEMNTKEEIDEFAQALSEVSR